MVKIVLDCLGGDHSPSANLAGALKALATFPDLELTLVGDEKEIKEKTVSSPNVSRIHIVHAPKAIGLNEAPTLAVSFTRRIPPWSLRSIFYEPIPVTTLS
jgi:phosphate acyltransferase